MERVSKRCCRASHSIVMPITAETVLCVVASGGEVAGEGRVNTRLPRGSSRRSGHVLGSGSITPKSLIDTQTSMKRHPKQMELYVSYLPYINRESLNN